MSKQTGPFSALQIIFIHKKQENKLRKALIPAYFTVYRI